MTAFPEIRILISSNPKNLQAADPDVTVEAEYGKVLVTGSLLTLAHHGDRGHNPPPSTRANSVVEGVKTIGISHMDLDTLGGILSVLGVKPEADSFWKLVGFCDLNGPHKLDQANASDEDLDRLNAFWAGSAGIKVLPPEDGSVGDVTGQVERLTELVEACIANDEDAIKAGSERRSNTNLNAASFRSFDPETGIILRQSESFCNHLYTTPCGQEAKAVVTQNPSENPSGGAITASLASSGLVGGIGDMLGEFFGPEAGGHPGIGGSERGKARPYSDAEAFAKFLGKQRI